MRRSPAATPGGTDVSQTPDEFALESPRSIGKPTLQPGPAPDLQDVPAHLALGQIEPRAIRPPHRGREAV